MAAGAGLRMAGTLVKLAARKVFRPKPVGPAGGAPFDAAFDRLLAAPSVAPEIARSTRLTLEANENGWAAAGLRVEPGDEISVIAAGTLWASKALDMHFGPRIGVWLRAGETGAIFKTPGDVASLRVKEGGPLFVVAKPPGEWADEQGRFDPAFPRAGIGGALSICVIVWKNGAAKGLEALARAGDYEGLVTRALAQARNPVSTPEGWTYLWRLGDGEIYRDVKSGESRHIHCRTHQDVGILQFPADFALTDTTRLRWRWKVDKLPCDLPEDIQLTHDYLSIAVEFDNGQDLTYMWSGSLAEGTIFRCPLPYWDKVETHWVLRSDAMELGRWLAEDRPVKADYARAIGAPPARIVRVWLIAVSVFQLGEGICDYADIELVDGERVLKVI
ncbi:MAG: DUF3047 domain-containing protein [Parvibaculum sp.]|uniref:DUF3047 domain-containing protein n=1 Tax=Parvibaculum sp. TaxID=2024848 RepID=UPI0025DAA8FE|nr:DUF3047 domain-containing protein [Parvibaculum sp.]MCE9650417.1 DUF3047 domain-containing protein [Parvibaculum sp.]